jgi:O-acetyl-ADP-ribose deacetylase (regulator of RNase III)
VGDAAITGAGQLPALYVIHAAAMGDTPPTIESIRSATRRALQLAAERGVRTVAFPVLGSGVGGFPFRDSARVMVEELREHGRAFAKPESVVLYGYTRQQADTLRLILDSGRRSG